MLAAFALAAAVAAPVDWLALPIASYNSDDGFAGGVVVQAQWLGRVPPYKAALGAQVLFSTAGVQSHYLRLDVPRLFGTPVRLWLGAEFHKELNAPYYGLGNNTSSDLALHPGLSADRAFSYRRRAHAWHSAVRAGAVRRRGSAGRRGRRAERARHPQGALHRPGQGARHGGDTGAPGGRAPAGTPRLVRRGRILRHRPRLAAAG